MRTKEEVYNDIRWSSVNSDADCINERICFEAMELYAKEVAVDFFKWNALKISEYIEYIRKVDAVDGYSEKEKEISFFEGSTIETRFELYLKSKQNEAH